MGENLDDATLLVELGEEHVFLRPVEGPVRRWKISFVHESGNELSVKAARPAKVTGPPLRDLCGSFPQIRPTSSRRRHHCRRQKGDVREPRVVHDEG